MKTKTHFLCFSLFFPTSTQLQYVYNEYIPLIIYFKDDLFIPPPFYFEKMKNIYNTNTLYSRTHFICSRVLRTK